MEKVTHLAESEVSAGEKLYLMTHPASPDALIDEREFELDERLPYWAEIWPSAIALARHLSEENLSGRKVLELGCGVGLPSTVALDRGAEVTATDHYEIALDFARHNAKVNTGRDLKTGHLDWHSSATEDLGRFDLILAADVLYERRNVSALVTLIPDLLAPEGEVLISDPRRRDTPHFVENMDANGFGCTTRSAIVRQGKQDIEVLIHRFQRGP